VKRNLAIFKNGANRYRELLAAVAAEVKTVAVRLALKLAISLYAATVEADWAIRPADGFKMLARRIFVVIARFGVGCVCHDDSPVDESF
jgi:hypothetical protein